MTPPSRRQKLVFEPTVLLSALTLIGCQSRGVEAPAQTPPDRPPTHQAAQVDDPPTQTPPTASAEPPAAGPVDAGAEIEPAQPSPDAPHPRLKRFVELASAWDPETQVTLRRVDLRGTAMATQKDVDRFLEQWLLVEIALPALRLGKWDKELRSLISALEGVGPHEVAIAHVNLTMGPVYPTACEPCELTLTKGCNQESCDRAREVLAPAVYSAGGFTEAMTFGGHPRAMEDGVGYTDAFTLTDYLDAAEAAGLERDDLRQRLLRVVDNVARRCRQYSWQSSPNPTTQPSMSQQLSEGIARWRAAYAPGSKDATSWDLPESELAALALWEAITPVERRLLSRFRSKAMRSYLKQSQHYRRETARLERELALGKSEAVDFPMRPDESDPCEVSKTYDESRASCGAVLQTVAMWDELAWSLRAATPGEGRPPALRLAEVLEHLTWAELSPIEIDGLLAHWQRETKKLLSTRR